MTERDEDVSRRYRELTREVPPAAIDQAILAASRRAVGARPGGFRRWSGPVSIAAVLVLAVGVVVQMQLEQPDVAIAPTRVQDPAATPSPTPASAPTTADTAAPAATSAPTRAPSRVEAKPERRVQALPATPPPQAPVQEPAQESARIDTARAERAAAAPAAATNAAASPPPPALAKRSAQDTSSEDVAGRPIESPDATLERIARLRAAGRHDEADRALEEFRRQHPDFRIPEAMWEKMRGRTP